MTIAIDELPDDPTLLKRFIVEREQLFVEERRERERLLIEERREREALIAQLKDEAAAERAAIVAQIREEAARQVESFEQRMAAMEAEHQAAMLALFRRYYGPRSEAFDPRQLLLFGQLVERTALDEGAIAQEAGEPLVTRRARSRHNHGRKRPAYPWCLCVA